MSHIRPKRFVNEICSRCARPGWKHEVKYSLLTQAEHNKLMGDNWPLEVVGLPAGYEPLSALCGSTIHSAVEEAIDYCRKYKVVGAGFVFNDKSVLVTANSNAKQIVQDWWKRSYNETYEQSMARR